jgi:hypothetical protein
MMDRKPVRNMWSSIPKQIREISASGWFYYRDRSVVVQPSNKRTKGGDLLEVQAMPLNPFSHT